VTLLSVRGVAIHDDALGPYPLPDGARVARTVALCIENGLGDREAWHIIVTDDTHLATYKLRYGNRKRNGQRKGPRR
jgi:hypothetical protein